MEHDNEINNTEKVLKQVIFRNWSIVIWPKSYACGCHVKQRQNLSTSSFKKHENFLTDSYRCFSNISVAVQIDRSLANWVSSVHKHLR